MVRITVQVKPGSKKGPLVEEVDGTYIVYVQDRAVDGAANEAVLKLLAKYLGLKSRQLNLESGHTSKIKRIGISR